MCSAHKIVRLLTPTNHLAGGVHRPARGLHPPRDSPPTSPHGHLAGGTPRSTRTSRFLTPHFTTHNGVQPSPPGGAHRPPWGLLPPWGSPPTRARHPRAYPNLVTNPVPPHLGGGAYPILWPTLCRPDWAAAPTLTLGGGGGGRVPPDCVQLTELYAY